MDIVSLGPSISLEAIRTGCVMTELYQNPRRTWRVINQIFFNVRQELGWNDGWNHWWTRSEWSRASSGFIGEHHAVPYNHAFHGAMTLPEHQASWQAVNRRNTNMVPVSPVIVLGIVRLCAYVDKSTLTFALNNSLLLISVLEKQH